MRTVWRNWQVIYSLMYDVYVHSACLIISQVGAQVATLVVRRPLTNAARVRFPAGDLIPVP